MTARTITGLVLLGLMTLCAARPVAELGTHDRGTILQRLGVVARFVGLVLSLILLSGCGGGDPEEPPRDQPPPLPLDCRARPEVCR